MIGCRKVILENGLQGSDRESAYVSEILPQYQVVGLGVVPG